jgi:hypothetical protein
MRIQLCREGMRAREELESGLDSEQCKETTTNASMKGALTCLCLILSRLAPHHFGISFNPFFQGL